MVDPCAAEARRAALCERVRSRSATLLELAQALVRTGSPNPPGETGPVARVAREWLRAHVPDAEVHEVAATPRIVNVVARVRGSGPGRRLVFNGHLDTYPLGDERRWSDAPLSGTVRDGRLHGRGAADMKGGIACSLLAFALLAELRDAWRGELVVTLAGDEETMGTHGTAHLLATVPWASGDAMICGDAGSPLVVRFGEKGFVWLEIRAEGRAAHGAHVHLGINAVDRLRRALDALDGLRGIVADGEAAQAVEIAGPGESAVLRAVTVNIGTLEAGAATNLVPASARATADIRLPAGVTVAAMEARIGELLGRIDGVSWRVLRSVDPTVTDPDHEIVRRTVENARMVLGRQVVANMRVGASDARLYRLRGIPSVVYGPTPFGMGGPDEHVLLDELHAVAAVHALTAFDVLAPHARGASGDPDA